ncbi:hypothetical protein F5Y05DRAFT_28517 [Hypoxylon sp. FL0543]|nr:hypothetical protein F5Y05DRAFT_28517 [Hypoxylon sp. FL0543]
MPPQDIPCQLTNYLLGRNFSRYLLAFLFSMASQYKSSQTSSSRRNPHRCDNPQECGYCRYKDRNKALREERRAQGLCSFRFCENPVRPGMTKCGLHLEMASIRGRWQYEERKGEQCTRCSGKLAPTSQTYCEAHLEIVKERNARHYAKKKAKREHERQQQSVDTPTYNGHQRTHSSGQNSTSGAYTSPYHGVVSQSGSAAGPSGSAAGPSGSAAGPSTYPHPENAYPPGWSQGASAIDGHGYGNSQGTNQQPGSYNYYPTQSQSQGNSPWRSYSNNDPWMGA